MSKLQQLRRLLRVLTVLTLLFIWGNSALPAAASNALSDWVRSLLPAFRGQGGGTSSFIIRKLAHFSEFAVLGALLTWQALLGGPVKWPPLNNLAPCGINNLALCGIFAALIDESIQLLSDRTSQVRDVWIDFGGFALGAAAAWGIALAVKRLSRKRRSADNVK
jgi:VanZ family protein